MSNHLVIRADASRRMGTGHVMRCLALAQAWQDTGGKIAFITCESSAVESRLKMEGMRVESMEAAAGSARDAGATVALARTLGAQWIVVDGYQFDSAYQKTIKDAGHHKLLWIDDYGHAAPYCADVVLNQNVYENSDLYNNCGPSTRLLLGARYALLRREFQEWRGQKRDFPERAQRILVTLGGGDPDNVTLKVIKAIEQLDSPELMVRVIVGAASPHLDSLRHVCSRSSKRIEIQNNVNNMPSLMAWAEVAVSAGGSTCWETAFMGLPNIIIVLATNQQRVAKCLDEMGVSINLGWHALISTVDIATALTAVLRSRERRIDMVEKVRNLIDGKGAQRITQILMNREGL